MAHLQIKDIPELVHRELRRRSQQERMTMRDYVLRLIEADQARPTMDEWLNELERDEPVELPAPAAELIRRGRAERDAELAERIGRLRGDAGH